MIPEEILQQKGDVVYTAIFGNIGDTIRPHPNSTNEITHFAFLENKLTEPAKTANWKISGPLINNNNARRQARAHKILSHRIFKNARYTLWIDGCLQIVHNNIQRVMEEYLQDSDICVFKHRTRKCVYEELFACLKQNKDDSQTMINQVNRYLNEGYPRNNGLAETTALLRRNCLQVNEFNEMWYHEIETGSCRDQLSFDYVAWKLGIKYTVFSGTALVNNFFIWHRH